MLIVLAALPSHALEWQWRDRFTPSEEEKLLAWIEEADSGIRALFGPLPYKAHIQINRLQGAREPVPWANTSKDLNPIARFYVDPSYSLHAFRTDWTAAHELSHLLFPYLGRSSRWFAEGIASYLQYQIMYAGGILDWQQSVEAIAGGFRRGQQDARAGDMPIPDISRMGVRAPKRMYWGGAAYFLHVDRRLAIESNQRLTDVLRKYVQCCWRMHRGNASSMIAQFDRLSGTEIFRQVYQQKITQRGFPETAEGLRWLRQHPPPLVDRRDGI